MQSTAMESRDATIAALPTGPPSPLPKITIQFCTQCRWMLRATYFAQELFSTFSGTQIGEISLVPETGGVFRVWIHYLPEGQHTDARTDLLWDRKTEGGFPETKVLKQRVRDRIESGRDLGHSDVGGKKKDEQGSAQQAEMIKVSERPITEQEQGCKDCAA